MSIWDYIYGRIIRGVITFVNIVTLAHRDWPYHDYHSDTTASTYQTYAVGENNILGDGDQTKRFVSKSLAILVTTNTYVVFNNRNNVIMTLLANQWYTFQSNIYAVHYAYVSVEGTIYLYPEGVLPQEARRPE